MKSVATLIGQTIVSKVLVDNAKIPYAQYKSVSPGLNELEKWANVFNDLELDKPRTWMTTTQKLVSRVAQKNKPDTPKKSVDHFSTILEELNYAQMSSKWFLSDLVWEAISKCEETELWKGGGHVYTKIHLPNNHYFIRRRVEIRARAKEESPDMLDFLTGKSRTPGDVEVREDVIVYPKQGEIYLTAASDTSDFKMSMFRALGEVLYGGQNTEDMYTVDWDQENGGFLVEDLKFPDRLYKGEALNYIPVWERYIEMGVRRCICLQGKPGTGKSTLARTVAKRLGRRTVKMTASAFQRLHFTQWKILLCMISPEVLILDDIDRIDDLEEYLDRFEDAYYHVPLTLFTSNDLKKLPGAFKRPGRIDQLLELSDPAVEVRLEVLREFAIMEKVGEIPDERVGFMLHLYENYSGAFAVEYLRRVKVEGWIYRIPKEDLTFTKLYGKEDEFKELTKS